MILTLAVCYHARIQEREKYRHYIGRMFKPPISKDSITEEKILKEILRSAMCTYVLRVK